MSARPPVIIMGMHRSGTGLVADVLREMGLFTGWRRDPNGEALFFQHLNDWMLRLSSGAWDSPQAIDYLLGDDAVQSMVVAYLRHFVNGPRSLLFLGPRRYASCRKLERVSFPWGWKDPRNTFTLPIWQLVFPQPLLIHVKRHGVDVAQSLVARRRRQLRAAAEPREQWRALYNVVPKRSGFVNTVRVVSLSSAFELWEDYVRRASESCAVAGSRAMELQYEELLATPEYALERLARFCDLPSARSQRAVSLINRDGAHRYREDSQLAAFAESVENRLASLGY